MVDWLVGWFVGLSFACLVGCVLTHLHGCSLARLLSPSRARLLACLLLLACFFVLLCLLMFICFAWLTCEGCAVEHQVEHQKLNQKASVEFLVFNLLALICLELARLVLGWLACFVDLVGLVACFDFVCFAVLLLLALLCFACLICFAMQRNAMLDWFHVVRLGFCPLGLVWLGRLASWHTLDLKNKAGIYRKGHLPPQDLKLSIMPDSSHKTISQFHFLMQKNPEQTFLCQFRVKLITIKQNLKGKIYPH